MPVIRDEEVGTRRNCTVTENVMIGIDRDDLEMEGRRDPEQVASG